MPFTLTPFFKMLLYIFSSTVQGNESSFGFTPIIQTLVGGILVIIGSIITGIFLIFSQEKAEIERKRVEIFVEIFDKFYAPIQEIAKEILKDNTISTTNSANLKKIIDNNRKFFLMCPEDIRKEIDNIREKIRDDPNDAIDSIRKVEEEIDSLLERFVFKK